MPVTIVRSNGVDHGIATTLLCASGSMPSTLNVWENADSVVPLIVPHYQYVFQMILSFNLSPCEK